MADDFGLRLESARDCSNSVRRIDGSYVGRLYRFKDKEVVSIPFRLGSDLPPIGDKTRLTHAIRTSLIETYTDLTPATFPIDKFVALAIMRVCNRRHHDDMPRNAKPADLLRVPRLERVLSLAYAADDADFVDIRPPRFGFHRTVNEHGVGRMRQVIPDEEGLDFRTVRDIPQTVFLPSLPEESYYPPFHAIAAFPYSEPGAINPHVALHLDVTSNPGREGGDFVEHIVRRSAVAEAA